VTVAAFFVAVVVAAFALDLFITLGRTLVRLWRHRGIR
jgi:hypothetical protein